RNIIAHKSALIVLDDVWEESYKVANYFIGTSPRTRWLVTTRNQAIVNELDATPVQLGMMHPDQAVQLMREWA
ncbi:MAG TPA: NB-ARC domain-containing protein, partial [Aggregatilineales bacterium]|nr:NB-ARC domain-containing protein [Aggregatilineales bacterium]